MKRVRMQGARPFPPRVSQTTAPFWEGLANGLWQTTACTQCGKLTFPPKAHCPFCWGRNMAWKPLSLGGAVYSSTVVHVAPARFAPHAPYRNAIVDLDDGVRLATRLIGAEDSAIGRRVEMVVLEFEDGVLFGAQVGVIPEKHAEEHAPSIRPAI